MSEFLREAKSAIESLLNDRIVLALLKNSSLTQAQFETFLIHVLGDDLANRTLTGEERTCLRIKKSKISRGSFNRTFIQARHNVVRSLYVVFLLGYVGLFDTPELEPFIETASRIKAYANHQTSTSDSQEASEILKTVMEQLSHTIEQLARSHEDL